MSDAGKELSLEEWVRRLPPTHRASVEYDAIRASGALDEVEKLEATKLNGYRGWLLVAGIWLSSRFILGVAVFFAVLNRGDVRIPLREGMFDVLGYLEALPKYAAAGLLLSGVEVLLFFSRRRSALPWIVAALCLEAAVALVEGLHGIIAAPDFSDGPPQVIGRALGGAIAVVLFYWYVSKSKRVRATFIK